MRRLIPLAVASVLGGCTLAAPVSAPVPEPAWRDVTATLDAERTPVYEGDPPMRFTFTKQMAAGDPLTLSSYTMGAHSGTHVDAPMHFIRDGIPVDQVALSALMGPAVVLDIADDVDAITAAELGRHAWRGATRVLFRTRSSRHGWMSSPAFHRDFSYLTADAAQALADAGVVLVGVDYLSAEKFGASTPDVHRILLGRGIPVVEGLQLADVAEGRYDLIVLPIKVAGHEGAPARAVVRPRP